MHSGVPCSNVFARLETESNYSSLARRIVAAVPGGSGFILVTGDPPASLQLLSQALSKATRPRRSIIGIFWEPGLTQAQLMGAASLLTAQPKGDETTVVAASSELAAPLVVFDDVDRLSQALNHSIFIPRKELAIPGDPEPTSEQFSSGAPVITLPTIRGRIEVQGPPEPDLPLFVFGEVHSLSQQQLMTIYGAISHSNWMGAVAVLLAPSDFFSRLEEPGLDFLKGRLFAQFLFQEIGQHKDDKFLCHRLKKKRLRHRVACATQSRLIWGLVGCVVLGTAGGAAISLEHSPKIGGDPSGLSGTKNSSTRELSALFLMLSSGLATLPPSELPRPPPQSVEMLQVTSHAVCGTPAQLKSARLTQRILPSATPSFSEPLATSQKAPPADLPTSIQPVTGVRLSPIEIATLKARGDEFLEAGDITSARLFYQRAADEGDGSSAWRLGATLDPAFLSRAGIRGISGDLDRASWWYQRARELDAAALLGSIGPKPPVEPAALPEAQHGVEPECIAGPAPACNGIDGTPTPPKRP